MSYGERVGLGDLAFPPLGRALQGFDSHQRSSPARIVVWEHNSHLGEARGTEAALRGELNVGQLVRQAHPDDCCLLGFTTYTGTVTAADDWGGPVMRKAVRPALVDRLVHDLPLPGLTRSEGGLEPPGLGVAVGVVVIEAGVALAGPLRRLRIDALPSGAPRAVATSYATGTPPRGRPSAITSGSPR
ncbi:erythromycin esterase family protein [Streptomyces sp. NPDC056580]|uniref:erythromycin esterase family protein n=1 Tax=Streptomyces sp. NPDC056580 TaxID=3345872 RepID=UPI0036C9750C